MIHRAGEEEPLSVFAPQDPRAAQLFRRFDALGDDVQPELARQGHDRRDDVPHVGARLHVAHECPIDLEEVRGELVKVGERRLARPEVVQADAGAHDAELDEHALHGGGVLHRHALGQLEHEPAGLEARLAQRDGDLIHETGAAELGAREIHGHPEFLWYRDDLLPRLQLPARVPEDPAAERRDQAGLLGDRDELPGRHQSQCGMLPAHERLEPGDAVRLERHDGLEVQHELVPIERGPEVGLELQFGLDRLHHGRVEHLAARTPQELRPVERGVGVPQHVLRPGVARGAHRDADAGRQEHFPPARREGGQDVREHTVRDGPRVPDFREAVEKNGELVPTQPRDEMILEGRARRVPPAQARLEAASGGRQEHVARRTLRPRAAGFGPVQVEQDHRELKALPALGPLDRARQVVEQQQAVRQSRLRVGDGLGRHVRVRSHQAGRLPALLAHDDGAARHPAVVAVPRPHAVPELEVVRAGREVGFDRGAHRLQVLGVDAAEPFVRRGADLALVEAEQSHPSGREVDPVGLQFPVPETLVVAARRQVVLVHASAMPLVSL